MTYDMPVETCHRKGYLMLPSDSNNSEQTNARNAALLHCCDTRGERHLVTWVLAALYVQSRAGLSATPVLFFNSPLACPLQACPDTVLQAFYCTLVGDRQTKVTATRGGSQVSVWVACLRLQNS